MKITDVAIDRPVFTTMMAVAVLVLGFLALTRLGVDLFPNISFPIVTVVTPYPGAGPREVESQVTKPLEDAVSSINGVDEVRSFSRDSISTLIITFKLEADVRQAVGDVRDRIGLIRGTLPNDIRDPIISRVDPTAMPVATFAVSSNRGSAATREFVDDQIRPLLERVEGVGSIDIVGGVETELRVEVDRQKLEGTGITLGQLGQIIGSEGIDVPAGRLTVGSREMSVKAAGRYASPSDLGEVVLLGLPSGAQVKVKDVATISVAPKLTRTISRVNDIESVTFDVQKQAGTNTVAVVDDVEKAISRLKMKLPADIKIEKIIDMSTFIRTNINHLKEELIIGGLLAVLVIFIFMLDWRSTLISALALPTSVIASFFVMWQLGFTLNIMTMMALTLSIGMLIDDSVVVRENIFRHLEHGENPVTAARKGTDEIALAVLATTFTIVAVFVPVAFTGGLIGQMFRQFGLTVAAAVIVSLIVSFTLDPMLSARIAQEIPHDYHERMRSHRYFGFFVRFYESMDRFYRDLLVWTLAHKGLVIAGAILIFVASLALGPLMGKEFFGRGDQGDFTVNIELPPGTALQETDRVTKQVEAILRGVNEVRTIASTIGPDEDVSKAAIRVKATPKTERSRSLAAIMEELRPKLAAVPGLNYNMREAGLGGSAESTVVQAPIVLYISGSDYDQLAVYALQAMDIVRSTYGTRDLAISYRPGMPEQNLVIDRSRAGDHGVSFAAAAMTLRAGLDGQVVGKYRDGEKDRDVRVQLQASDRENLNNILNISVASRSGKGVPLRDIVTVREESAPSTIERLDRRRQITITANVAGRSLGEVLGAIEAKLAQQTWPPGYAFRFGGEAERMQETFSNLGLAMGLAIIFIYIVLASQFESFLHPFTIMLALPLAIVGALSLLFLSNMPIGMPAMIGMILLMGLVTKNSILLVDYTNQLRRKGHSVTEALLEAGPTRLRPILMTSAAIVLGMLPAALGRGEGSELRAPMSMAVIGGVITSTLLTLIVVPAVYVLVDRLSEFRRAPAAEPDDKKKGIAQ